MDTDLNFCDYFCSKEWEVLSEILLLENGSADFNSDARISWRGDGKFLATNVCVSCSR